MARLKLVIVSVVIGYFLCWALVIYKSIEPDYSQKECDIIKKNFDQIELGMSKKEVLSIINKEPDYKISRYPGLFLEQKTVWEFWLLCKEKPYQWQMIAFDSETEKVVKVFYDELERIGFD